jgi:hypothetical protein
VDYRNNFAPRVAFAYAPRQGSTVLRGGFGRIFLGDSVAILLLTF